MEQKTDYKVVTTLHDIRQYMGDAKEAAFDFETAPDNIFRQAEKAALDPAKSHICTMSISVREKTGIMIPVAHRTGTNIDPCLLISTGSSFRYLCTTQSQLVRCHLRPSQNFANFRTAALRN